MSDLKEYAAWCDITDGKEIEVVIVTGHYKTLDVEGKKSMLRCLQKFIKQEEILCQQEANLKERSIKDTQTN